MELRQFLRIVFRQRYTIVLVCLSAILTSTGLTYVLSDKYQTSTKMLIRPRTSMDLVPKHDEILGYPVSYYTSIDTASKTYSEIITSRAVCEKIVKALELDVIETPTGSGFKFRFQQVKNKTKELLVKGWTLLKYGKIKEDDPFNYAVGKVQRSLKVNPTSETYMFELECEVKSPVLAAAIANTAAEVLVEYLQESNALEQNQAKEISKVNVNNADNQLREARHSLSDFKKNNNIVSLKEESILHLGVLLDLEASLSSVKREIKGIFESKKEMSGQLENIDPFTKSTTKVSDNPIVQELQLSLVQKEIALVGLINRYTDEHRDVQGLTSEIAEIKKELKKYPETINSEVMTEVNPLYQKLLIDIADLDAALKSYEAKSISLIDEISEKKKLLDHQSQQESELANLELAVKLYEEKYMFISKKWQETEINNTGDVPNIKQVNIAAVPLYPSRPIKIFHAGLAGVLSFIVGIGIALLKESMNVTVRTIDEAEKLLAMPVIMTIPKLAVGHKTQWFIMEQGRKQLPEFNRKDERICVQSHVAINGEKMPKAVEGELVDISLGGVCVRLNEAQGIIPEDRINLEIELLSKGVSIKKIELEGVVLRLREEANWNGDCTVAAAFRNLSEQSAEEIKQLIKDKPGVSFLLPPDFEEPIRGLRSGIQAFSKDGKKSFLVTSCRSKEGKSTIITNLAQSLIGTDKSTVLIDANLRDSSLHKIFGLSNETGLTTFLSNGRDISMKKVSPGLTVITSGPTVKDPGALLGSRTMEGLVESLKLDFDYVLIDGPALLGGCDSELLAAIADAAIIVLDAESTSMDDATHAKEILEKTNTRIIGTIMNNYNPDFESYYSFS